MYWIILSALLLVHWAIIAYLLHRLRLRLRDVLDLSPLLQKTKFQLHREIARHGSTEEELIETRDYLNSLINSLPAIVIGVCEEGYVTHWNTSAESHTGLLQLQALGQKLSDVLLQPNIDIADIKKSLSTQLPLKWEAIPQGSGIERRYTDITIQPLIGEETQGAVILIQDVTLRVRVEKSMIQNEKMLSLGEMAAGLAHEINNPLAAILSNLQTIERRLSRSLESNIRIADSLELPFPALQKYLENRKISGLIDSSIEAGERAAKIVKTMLEFSHAHNSEFSDQNIIDLINQSLGLAANTLEIKGKKSAKMPFVIRDFQPDIPTVECSASEIQQVLLNILLNAAQALHSAQSPNPTINIRVAKNKQYVDIAIHDNGPGMSEDVQKHVFEPFFTTKEVGSGTGLGLSVSYFIVKDHHNGSIELSTRKGAGTTFKISLPIKQPSKNDIALQLIQNKPQN